MGTRPGTSETKMTVRSVARLRRAVLSARGAAVAAWLLVAAGSLYADALASASASAGFRSAVSAGLWVVFAAVLAAMVLPGPLALTAARVAVPANLAASVWALAVIDDRLWLGHGVALAAAAVAAAAVLHPAFGDAVTDASSYGAERRFLLRAPGPVLLTLVAPMWLLTCAGVAAGPLLLADRRWPAGAAATLIGWPAALLAGRALHRLARRWLVFVPAGLVVHDHLTLAQPVLLTRSEIASVGPAPADAADAADLTAANPTDPTAAAEPADDRTADTKPAAATVVADLTAAAEPADDRTADTKPAAATVVADLTAAALGLALEVRLAGPAELPVVAGRRREKGRAVTALLVSPTLSARVLAAAADRGIPVTASRDN